MLPTLEEMRTGATQWHKTHRGVSYSMSHHGVSSYSPDGTWCYYLYLRKETFQDAADFAKFDMPLKIEPGFAEKFMGSYDYYAIPDLDFHGGVTWYSKDPYVDAWSGEVRECLKIGCDYNHSWDRDEGYWQGFEDVDRDAKRTIDHLANRFPLNDRCAYSGKLDKPENFYTAVNGGRVHVSQEAKIDDGWLAWKRAPDASA